jgi:hypothetical protein
MPSSCSKAKTTYLSLFSQICWCSKLLTQTSNHRRNIFFPCCKGSLSLYLVHKIYVLDLISGGMGMRVNQIAQKGWKEGGKKDVRAGGLPSMADLPPPPPRVGGRESLVARQQGT